MNVLFITIGAVYNFNNSGAYTDLLKHFGKEGHDVYVVGAIEKRNNQGTTVSVEHGINVLRVKVGNITKTNLIEKGISTLIIGSLYEKAIQRYWSDKQFDLIIYTTPPITIGKLVAKLKRKYNAFTYLLLKDIFPQNAVDIGMLSKTGFKGIIYKYFRTVEKKLYNVSDKIGCMSQGNLDYVLKHNGFVEESKIEICPNTIDVIPECQSKNRDIILRKYGIPSDKKILLYGGNFGKPQNVPYIIDALKECASISEVHFVLCGSGTDFHLVEEYIKNEKPKHVSVIKQLPYEEYSRLVAVCNVGLLFLDYRFTIPNFPSRLLDYMNQGLPVIAATDKNTDVGKTIVDGEFGWWVESNNPKKLSALINSIFNVEKDKELLREKSVNARNYLNKYFETTRAYNVIISAYEKGK